MSRPGGKKKPTVLKILEGTLRADRANPNEPKYKTVVLRAPTYLCKERKKLWRKWAKILTEPGILTIADASMFEQLIEVKFALRKNQALIDEVGGVRLVKAPSGYPMISPLHTIHRQLSMLHSSLCGEFGLSPSSRPNVSGTQNKKKPATRFNKVT